MSTNGITAEASLREIDGLYGFNRAVRVFDGGLPLSWDHKAPPAHQKGSLLRDRSMLIWSFEPPPREVNTGQHDAYLRRWFQMAPDHQIIFWSYIHEPEDNITAGEFTAEEYKRAWRRIVGLANEACKPNLFATLILMGWTTKPAARDDYRNYDAGPEYIKVLAFDPYNGAVDPGRTYYASAKEMFESVVTTMKADGRPWGIAETASRLVPGDDGTARAAWVTSIGNYLESNGATFVTYFHSMRDGHWKMNNDPYSAAAWRALVER